MMNEALQLSPAAILAIQCAHVVGGIIVAIEALNKLERTDPLAPGMSPRERLVAALKVAAWIALALGGAGAVAGPLLGLAPPDLGDALTVGGFALLIVRSRLKEPIDGRRPSSDDLGATTVIDAAEIRRHIQRTNAAINPAMHSAAEVAADIREKEQS